jgi:hypothetical protein
MLSEQFVKGKNGNFLCLDCIDIFSDRNTHHCGLGRVRGGGRYVIVDDVRRRRELIQFSVYRRVRSRKRNT